MYRFPFSSGIGCTIKSRWMHTSCSDSCKVIQIPAGSDAEHILRHSRELDEVTLEVEAAQCQIAHSHGHPRIGRGMPTLSYMSPTLTLILRPTLPCWLLSACKFSPWRIIGYVSPLIVDGWTLQGSIIAYISCFWPCHGQRQLPVPSWSGCGHGATGMRPAGIPGAGTQPQAGAKALTPSRRARGLCIGFRCQWGQARRALPLAVRFAASASGPRARARLCLEATLLSL